MNEQEPSGEQYPHYANQGYCLPIRGRENRTPPDLPRPPPPPSTSLPSTSPPWTSPPPPLPEPWTHTWAGYLWQHHGPQWHPQGHSFVQEQNFGQQEYGQVQQRPMGLQDALRKQDDEYDPKTTKASKPYTRETKKRDPKIMRPAPKPTPDYLKEAMEQPFSIKPPDRVLVILDLNGTLIYRPSRKRPTHMIARPFLKPFLQFLFENFSVMVWSSAKPENVRVLVEEVLDEDQRSKLVACWGRETFGLTELEYNQNVQVYKDLTWVWDDDTIQRKKPGYTFGKRFGQDCTILIDDSQLKANAQPYNLLEIPEFTATEEQMNSDILREVAGYLRKARKQNNVSSFMREKPFKADGTWQYDWPDNLAEGGVIGGDVSLVDGN